MKTRISRYLKITRKFIHCILLLVALTLLIFDKAFAQPTVEITYFGPLTFCQGGFVNLCATVCASGCQGPYKYKWINPLDSNFIDTNQCITATASAPYCVYVTCKSGCTPRACTAVNVLSNPNVSIAVSASVICSGQSTTLTAGGAVTYTWSPATGLNTTTGATVIASPASSTTYTVTGALKNGCKNTVSFTVIVNPLPATPVIVATNGLPLTCDNNVVFTVANPSQYTGFLWSTNVTGAIINPGPTSSSVSVTWPAGTQNAQISVTVTNANGCSKAVTIDVPQCCLGPVEQTAGQNKFANNTNAANFIAQNGGSTIFNNKNIIINGLFTVNTNLTFINCRLLMGKLARIDVVQGTLKLECSLVDVNNSCTTPYMWDGIYVSPGATLQTTNAGCSGSSSAGGILHAFNAVVSNGGAVLDLAGYFFVNNLKSVVLNSFNAAHPASVKGCFFTAPALMNPLSGVRGETGVEINNVADVTIGTTGTNNKNTFSNLYHGIKATGSNVISTNNTYDNLTYDVPNNKNAFGIHSTGANKANTSITAVTANTFSNCDFGIFTTSRQAVTIKGCTLNIVSKAIFVEFNGGKTITIQNNTLNDFNFGIFCQSVNSATVNISANKLTQTQPVSFFPIPYGILVLNPMVLTKLSSTTIENNTITGTSGAGVATGILCTFVASLKIQNNTITITKDNAFVASQFNALYGIQVINCIEAAILNNTVQRTSANVPAAAISEKLFGISIENSPQNLVQTNSLLRLGSGIKASESCPNSKFLCNTLNQNFYGVFLEKADIGDQGWPSGNNKILPDNKWINNITGGNRINGIVATPTNWAFRANPSFYSLTSNYIDVTPILDFTTTSFTSGFTGCSASPNLFSGPSEQKREQMFGAIVREEKLFSLKETEFKYTEKQYAFVGLREDSLIQLGTPGDSLFMAFNTTTDHGNIGKFEKVRKHIAQEELMLAEQRNQTIVTSNLMEENKKSVNEIFLRTWALESKGFIDADSSMLESIACQNTLDGGEAVYSARVMLGMNTGCGGAMLKSGKKYEKESKDISEDYLPIEIIAKPGSIYFGDINPNPNNGSMRLDYNVANGVNAELIITDVQGMQVAKYVLNPSGRKLSIENNTIGNGVYFYTIKVNGDMIMNKKLVIIK